MRLHIIKKLYIVYVAIEKCHIWILLKLQKRQISQKIWTVNSNRVALSPFSARGGRNVQLYCMDSAACELHAANRSRPGPSGPSLPSPHQRRGGSTKRGWEGPVEGGKERSKGVHSLLLLRFHAAKNSVPQPVRPSQSGAQTIEGHVRPQSKFLAFDFHI